MALAANQLKSLTPLFSKSDPPGALTVPATWAAVVQLRATFGDRWAPGPGLLAWINEQAALRCALVVRWRRLALGNRCFHCCISNNFRKR